MDNAFDIPDSTDWLNTPLSIVAPLESALRCQVCKDFFDNPVITSCCHTFCSLCIRRCLSTEGKCPACRSPDQELKLRRNWAVQEIVDSFRNARPSVLSIAREKANAGQGEGEDDLEQPAAKKRRLDQPDETNGIQSEGRRTRSRGLRSENQVPTAEYEVIEDSEDDDYVPDDGLVACPVCNRRMKEEAVFTHLDVCKGPQDPSKTPRAARSFPIGPQAPRNQSNNTAKTPERLPVINYSILKEGELRKKLRNLGIPDWGPRPLLQRRHTEWMNLWNANCDAKVPKSKRELLRELEIWERTQGGLAPTSQNGSNSVMRKDFDPAAWSASHDDEFKRLIQNARKKNDAVTRSTKPQPPASQQEEESSPNTSNEVGAAGAPPSESKEEEKSMEQSMPVPDDKLSQEAGPREQGSSQNHVLDAPVA
ncbi:hypothetical protein VTN77DRAFT_8307 [Rasamsonia byssochlamydoides]|uniref:uncharacterized protein n=1 Tax=Rasamsonia byssochlamydoides TaxID=89139 RepID=UPI0037420BC8